jgi:endoglucanase
MSGVLPLEFSSEKGGLFVNGVPFKLKGVSWFGFETPLNVVHGIWARDYRDLLDFIKQNGFQILV